MTELPNETVAVLKYLEKEHISPILYGSQGVSVYLGSFKQFGDIDLLVDERLLNDEWSRLRAIMSNIDFSLVDEKEHEFKNTHGQTVAFAGEKILVRDGILKSLEEVIIVEMSNVAVKTLSPQAFVKAYRFSEKDGYRKAARGKNDKHIITLLDDYISR